MPRKDYREKYYIEEWENDFLLLTYFTDSNKEIGKILKRNRQQIRYLAKRLGLRKPEKINVGDRFTNLIIIRRLDIIKHHSYVWECRCDCGKLTNVKTNTLLSGYTKSCGCLRKRMEWKGCGDISGVVFGKISRGAEQRKIEFSVTIEYLNELYQKQNKKCALTNIKLEANKRDCVTASLDRIDSNKGYIKGNVQWVYKDVNIMKWNLNQKRFIQLCKLIVKKDINDRKYSKVCY